MNRVILEITSYIGISLGATHYYGTLKAEEGDTIRYDDVYKKLTKREAARYSKLDQWQYEEGSETSRFEDKDELIRYALELFAKEFPDAHILVCGSYATADPQKVLWCCDSEIGERLNAIYDEFERHGGWEDPSKDKETEKITDKWDKVIKEFIDNL